LTASVLLCKLESVAAESPRSSDRYLQVFVSVPKQEDGERIATTLVQEKLAACVQVVGPIRSVYRWQGSVEAAAEFLCLAKTAVGRFPALEQRVTELHPYEVPEVIAVPISDGNPAYLDWLSESILPPGD
jgi:periplasmic divalent cation tolerance protein